MLEIIDLSVSYPRGRDEKFMAVEHIDLCAADGEITVIVGPSGCGKTTILKAIAGLIPCEQGRILLDGADAAKLETKDRNIAFVSQKIALYPTMTVYDNIAMPLRAAKAPPSEIDRRIKETAKLLEIDWLLSRKPGKLSGGQQQRVAIARAIVKRPALYLFDEPFSNIDAELRDKMQHELLYLGRMLDAPILFVTHDRREAMLLADKLVVMAAGSIRQQGAPLDVYHHPADDEVKDLLCGV